MGRGASAGLFAPAMPIWWNESLEGDGRFPPPVLRCWSLGRSWGNVVVVVVVESTPWGCPSTLIGAGASLPVLLTVSKGNAL